MTEGFDLTAHGKAMRAQGWWQDKTIDDLLGAAVAKFPDKPAIIAYRQDKGFDVPVKSLTYAELETAVAKAAGGFKKLGIGKGGANHAA